MCFMNLSNLEPKYTYTKRNAKSRNSEIAD